MTRICVFDLLPMVVVCYGFRWLCVNWFGMLVLSLYWLLCLLFGVLTLVLGLFVAGRLVLLLITCDY